MRSALRSIRQVFSDPDLRRFELSSCGHIISEWSFVVAISVAAFEVGGVGAVGLVGFLRSAPSALAAPFGAAAADRWGRERVLVLSYCARGIALALAALGTKMNSGAIVLYLIAGLTALVSSVIRPAQWSIPPRLARTPEELTAAMVSWTTVEGVSVFAGPALAGVLLAWGSTVHVFAAGSIVCLASAIAASRIRAEGAVYIDTDPTEEAKGAFMPGFKAIMRDRETRLIFGLFGGQTITRGLLNVLIVVAAIDLVEMGRPGVGFLNSAMGIGGLAGGILTMSLVRRRGLGTPFAAGLFLWGAPIAVIGLLPSKVTALLMLAIVGIGNAIGDVAGLTLLQRVAPPRLLARVFGLLEGMVFLSVGIGSVLAPTMVGSMGPSGAHIAAGMFLPVLTIISLRGLRRLDEAALPPAEFDLITRADVFSPLPLTTVDQIAAHLVAKDVQAGDVVFREGEPGDVFYLIAHGSVEVSSDGSRLAALTDGDYFGEIALVREVPRTATVRATSDTRLLALDRGVFLAAVSCHPTSRAQLEQVVGRRLQAEGSVSADAELSSGVHRGG